MKLTKTIREAFVRSVMNDVPKIDYNEQALAVVTKAFFDAAPPEIQAIITTNGVAKNWLNTSYYSCPRGLSSVTVFRSQLRIEKLDPSFQRKLDELASAAAAQETARYELSQKLSAAALSVTTRKALVTLLPEFEKYLPADEQAACRTLPAVANVMADFVKAGWPKG